MRKDIFCPYCNKELDIDHDGGYGYSEGELHQQECSFCKKVFVYTTSITYNYYPERADCLNDGQHDWLKTTTYPVEYTMMYCAICGLERSLTDEEKVKNMINEKSL